MVAGAVSLPGAGRVLRTLHGAGYRLRVVSTKYRYWVEEAPERDARRVFAEVVVDSDDDVPPPKPAPDGLPRAGGAFGTATGDCVFVGDPEVDAKAAQAAGMGFVPVFAGVGEIVPE